MGNNCFSIIEGGVVDIREQDIEHGQYCRIVYSIPIQMNNFSLNTYP